MVLRLRVVSLLPKMLLAKWVAAWRAASSQVEGASTEVEAETEAHVEEAWKSIDQLS